MKLHIRPATSWCLLAGLLVTLAASGAQAASTIYRDEIYLRGQEDKPIVTSITADTIKEIKAGGAVFNPLGVLRVVYSGAPQGYRNAEAHRESGRFEEALTGYQTTLRNLTDKDRKFWLEPHCRYYIAECYLEMGDLARAEAAYTELLDKHPDTRFKPDAMMGRGRVNYEAGNFAAAERRFDDLEVFAAKASWPVWLYEAYGWKARCLRKQKAYSKALDYVRKVIVAPPRKYEDIITLARTEEALIYVDQGEYDKAAGLLNKQIDRIAPSVDKGARFARMEAQCKNALGNCYLKRFEKSKDKKDLQEALIGFLWNVTLHVGLPERTEALTKAAACFEQLGQKTRAVELRDELQGKEPK
ncbi:MAG: tetratricopeptide repeat protein [Candidatus Brocadiae bacterium]|nr:tetratricopeptide repeat protein [Candidatus Brocadiia bacterium]